MGEVHTMYGFKRGMNEKVKGKFQGNVAITFFLQPASSFIRGPD